MIVGVQNVLKGLRVTFGAMFRKPVTVAYPERKRPVTERWRGRHELKRYENGLERCIGCSLCSAACPSDAILVVPAENSDLERFSPGERYAEVYEINLLRCIFCGYCEEACPVNAIVLEKEYELASFDRKSMILTKTDLLVPPGSEGKDTPQDTRGQDIPFRMGGMDYFKLPGALKSEASGESGPATAPMAGGTVDERAPVTVLDENELAEETGK